MSFGEESVLDQVEQVLFHENSVWIYRIPPRLSSGAEPRAEHWDPDHPLMTGSMKIVRKGDECYIQLFEPLKENADNAVLFAECHVAITDERTLEVYIQDCADSSRYFVVRVEDEKTKKHAYLGIGFAERSAAFNFKSSLQDHVRYIQRLLEAKRQKEEHNSLVTASAQDGGTPASTHDYSLQEGQMLKLNINIATSSSSSSTKQRPSHGSANPSTIFTGILAPPPPPPSDEPVALESTQPAKEAATVVPDDGWGDFTSSS